MSDPLFTIGHSNYTLERFLQLLEKHQIEILCDVRSHPYSVYCPHFNREMLEAALTKREIRYQYVGKELGGRTEDERCLQNGKVDYLLLAQTELFRNGLHRLEMTMSQGRTALMCAEKDPITCHRTILVCRYMRGKAEPISHILEDGEIETRQGAEMRLMALLKIESPNLFYAEEELIEQAYDRQSGAIAYELAK